MQLKHLYYMRCWDCKENQVVNQTPHRPRTTKKKKKENLFPTAG